MFYQDPKDGDEKKEKYSGANNRRKDDRITLSPQLQELVNIMDKRFGSCNGGCVIPKDFPTSKAISTIAEAGDGNYYRGIESYRDVHNESKEALNWWGNTKATIWKTVLVAIILALGSFFAFGVVQKIRSLM